MGINQGWLGWRKNRDHDVFGYGDSGPLKF